MYEVKGFDEIRFQLITVFKGTLEECREFLKYYIKSNFYIRDEQGNIVE